MFAGSLVWEEHSSVPQGVRPSERLKVVVLLPSTSSSTGSTLLSFAAEMDRSLELTVSVLSGPST